MQLLLSTDSAQILRIQFSYQKKDQVLTVDLSSFSFLIIDHLVYSDETDRLSLEFLSQKTMVNFVQKQRKNKTKKNFKKSNSKKKKKKKNTKFEINLHKMFCLIGKLNSFK